MAEASKKPSVDEQAEQRIAEILRAAASWSREAPSALEPAIRAVCVRLAEMVADQRYRMEANQDYFKGAPTVAEIDMPIVRDPVAAFAALRTGEVDFVTRNVPAELSEQFAGESELEVVTGTKLEWLAGLTRSDGAARVADGAPRCT